MAKILVIDDEKDFRDSIIETLIDLGAEALGADSVKMGLKALDQHPFDAVFIDYRMPEIDGLRGMKMIKEWAKGSTLPVVMITALLDNETTIAAMKEGAFDHLTKPLSRDDIKRTYEGILRAYPSTQKPKPAIVEPIDRYSLIGKSTVLKDLLKLIGKVSSHDSSILITGETGTGKELVARAIHRNSDRRDSPFIAINCAAIPENLLESELFGHVKGAFTGATHDRKGSFLLAEKGTLLLDEIGDMSLNLQAKLLRTLQEREITPLGSNRPIKIDVRFLAATHQDLRAMVEKKQFREDLYYRLNVVEINVPPLRERSGDIGILAQHFLEQIILERGSSQKQLDASALVKLNNHNWPGNIRELKNVIERASIISSGAMIEEEDIRILHETSQKDIASHNLDLPTAVAELEKNYISRALKESAGNRSEASRKLGIQRQLLYSKMKEYRIDL